MTLLSICIPTCDRPDLVLRALSSVTDAAGLPMASQVEVVVSDNSADGRTEAAVRPLLATWPGPTRYVHNVPNIGMVGNFNRCVELARGRWLLILHDDDYLTATGLRGIARTLCLAEPSARAVLFGARVVNANGDLLRRQAPLIRRSLCARDALRKHLSHSSYVRFPAIAVHREAYSQVGPFDHAVGHACDLDMWSRVFAAFGVRLEPTVVVAYVVHADAATESMFSETYVDLISGIFDRAITLNVLPRRAIRRAKARWFHQFVLAGTLRRLRDRDRAGAAVVMQLFDHSTLRELGVSGRWLPLRIIFFLATRTGHTPSRRAGLSVR